MAWRDCRDSFDASPLPPPPNRSAALQQVERGCGQFTSWTRKRLLPAVTAPSNFSVLFPPLLLFPTSRFAACSAAAVGNRNGGGGSNKRRRRSWCQCVTSLGCPAVWRLLEGERRKNQRCNSPEAVLPCRSNGRGLQIANGGRGDSNRPSSMREDFYRPAGGSGSFPVKMLL